MLINPKSTLHGSLSVEYSYFTSFVTSTIASKGAMSFY